MSVTSSQALSAPAGVLPPSLIRGAGRPVAGGAGVGAGGESFAASLAAQGGNVGAGLAPAALNTRTEAQTRAAIHKSAQDFEAMALGQLMSFMSESVEVDPTFGGGHGEEMFRQMISPEYGKLIQKSGKAGIAQPVEQALLRAQGLAPLIPSRLTTSRLTSSRQRV